MMNNSKAHFLTFKTVVIINLMFLLDKIKNTIFNTQSNLLF